MKYKIAIGGIMGVPITFLDKYNHKMGGYDVVGLTSSASYVGLFRCYAIINGKNLYHRILIRRKIHDNQIQKG